MQEGSLKRNSKYHKIFKWFLLFLVVSLLVTSFYLPSYFRLKRFKEENKRIIKEIEKIKKEIVKLQENLESLEKNPYLLEKIAREEIGVIKDNEIVIDIKE